MTKTTIMDESGVAVGEAYADGFNDCQELVKSYFKSSKAYRIAPAIQEDMSDYLFTTAIEKGFARKSRETAWANGYCSAFEELEPLLEELLQTIEQHDKDKYAMRGARCFAYQGEIIRLHEQMDRAQDKMGVLAERIRALKTQGGK